MLVLGIETSCDETAAAVVGADGEVRSSVVYSQIAAHRPFGGVVPEIACRAHVETLPGVINEAMEQAGVGLDDIDRIAVTRGPGLASSLLVGVSAAKALALRLGKPLYGVNHLEGHVCSVFLAKPAPIPEEHCRMLVLLVSGGHSCLLSVESPGDYKLLGSTLDDAAGEALDKGAKLMGLGYPGGPEIEKMAVGGNPAAVRFPRGRPRASARTGGLDSELCFSFSGLKTALRTHLQREFGQGVLPPPEALPDLAASYQQAVVDALSHQLETALQKHPAKAVGCVGGVAKNKLLRAEIDRLTGEHDIPLFLAPMAYCTDNAAMIAAVVAGAGGEVDDDPTFEIKPSWPLG